MSVQVTLTLSCGCVYTREAAGMAPTQAGEVIWCWHHPHDGPDDEPGAVRVLAVAYAQP